MTTNPITQRILALMKARGITRAELGRALSIPYHRLNPWFVRPAAKPNAEDLDALAKYFGVPAGHIINGDPIPEPAARDWILKVYDELPPQKREHLEAFVRFLAEEERNQGTEQGSEQPDPAEHPDR